MPNDWVLHVAGVVAVLSAALALALLFASAGHPSISL